MIKKFLYFHLPEPFLRTQLVVLTLNIIHSVTNFQQNAQIRQRVFGTFYKPILTQSSAGRRESQTVTPS